MSWWPRIAIVGHTISDGIGEDAEGWVLSIEWRGHMIEIGYVRRGAAPVE